jgi:hypothetical protein
MAWYEKATDDFNRADENPLSKGGMWQGWSDRPKMKVLSNVATLNTFAVFNFSMYTGVRFGPNQYVQSTNAGTSGYMGHVLRANGMPGSSAAASWYFVYWNSGNNLVNMFRILNGVGTQIITNAAGNSAAGTFRSEFIGSNFKLYRNSVQIATVNDSVIPTGYPGICLNDTPAVHNNFSAGDDGTGLFSPFPAGRPSALNQ